MWMKDNFMWWNKLEQRPVVFSRDNKKKIIIIFPLSWLCFQIEHVQACQQPSGRLWNCTLKSDFIKRQEYYIQRTYDQKETVVFFSSQFGLWKCPTVDFFWHCYSFLHLITSRFVFTCNYSVGLVGNPHIYLRPEQPEGLPAVLLWGRTRRETVAELWGVPPGSPPPDVSRRPTVSITGKINTAEEWSRHFDLDSFIKGCSHQEAFNIGFIVS